MVCGPEGVLSQKADVLSNLIPPLPVMCLMVKAGTAIDFLFGEM